VSLSSRTGLAPLRGLRSDVLSQAAHTRVAPTGRSSFVRSPYSTHQQAIPYPVEPQLGNWRLVFEDVIVGFANSVEAGREASEALLADVLEQGTQTKERDAAAFAFTLSLLIDIVDSGGQAVVRDSGLWAYWPEWDGSLPAHRSEMRQALERLKPVNTRSYEPDLSPKRALPFLRDMELSVVDATSDDAAEAFRQGITTWSMPYRGREGRARRLVVFGYLDRERHALGLLEVGDEAPHSPARDSMCGFMVDLPEGSEVARMRHGAGGTFRQWLAAQGHQGFVLDALADRLAGIRSALRPVVGYETSSPLAHLAASLPAIRSASSGRLGLREDIEQRKRLAYLGRLVAGEVAFRQHATEGQGIREGLRVLHDLTVPRIQVEATVCGALPPFGPHLVGKLIASLFGHPQVRSLLNRDVGSITRSLFDDSIERFLPRHGVLLVTTKGLFAGHSAQYNRVTVVGRHGPINLAHVADTVGTSTSLLADRTARLAEALLRHEASSRSISREYGSGGGKRQRTIESAALSVGLNEAIVHAKFHRPVYAVPFVANLPNVALLNEPPDWLIDPSEDDTSFERRSLAEWKSRWLPVALRRTR